MAQIVVVPDAGDDELARQELAARQDAVHLWVDACNRLTAVKTSVRDGLALSSVAPGPGGAMDADQLAQFRARLARISGLPI